MRQKLDCPARTPGHGKHFTDSQTYRDCLRQSQNPGKKHKLSIDSKRSFTQPKATDPQQQGYVRERRLPSHVRRDMMKRILAGENPHLDVPAKGVQAIRFTFSEQEAGLSDCAGHVSVIRNDGSELAVMDYGGQKTFFADDGRGVRTWGHPELTAPRKPDSPFYESKEGEQAERRGIEVGNFISVHEGELTYDELVAVDEGQKMLEAHMYSEGAPTIKQHLERAINDIQREQQRAERGNR